MFFFLVSTHKFDFLFFLKKKHGQLQFSPPPRLRRRRRRRHRHLVVCFSQENKRAESRSWHSDLMTIPIVIIVYNLVIDDARFGRKSSSVDRQALVWNQHQALAIETLHRWMITSTSITLWYSVFCIALCFVLLGPLLLLWSARPKEQRRKQGAWLCLAHSCSIEMPSDRWLSRGCFHSHATRALEQLTNCNFRLLLGLAHLMTIGITSSRAARRPA